jgi:hypothetical protein
LGELYSRYPVDGTFDEETAAGGLNARGSCCRREMPMFCPERTSGTRGRAEEEDKRLEEAASAAGLTIGRGTGSEDCVLINVTTALLPTVLPASASF